MCDTEWIDNRKLERVNTYQEELEQAHEHYVAKVMEIAARARRDLVVPYLRLCQLEFTQGNGTWIIEDRSKIRNLPNGQRDWRSYAHDLTDNLPDWLERLMRLEVEGTQGNPELALWMQDFTLRNTKNRGGY